MIAIERHTCPDLIAPYKYSRNARRHFEREDTQTGLEFQPTLKRKGGPIPKAQDAAKEAGCILAGNARRRSISKWHRPEAGDGLERSRSSRDAEDLLEFRILLCKRLELCNDRVELLIR